MIPAPSLAQRRALIATGLLAPWLPARAAADSAVDFSDMRRQYVKVPGALELYQERGLHETDRTLASNSAVKLADVLRDVLAVLPAHVPRELGDLKVFLMWGPPSPLGGDPSGMRYVRRGEGQRGRSRDPRWDHALVVYSADNLMYLNALWSRKALMHELAHAWHLTHWPERHAPMVQAWQNARDRGLYRDVASVKGTTIASAYAAQNPLEYFAEVSAAYFVGIDYAPFDRAGLKMRDPMGHDLVRSLWRAA
ncbi:hypothetical protein [Rhizobacter sp. Root1221]|uniref:hypothetical protein n=1 Tax=Rhizobacter sp. Root1221 TaxID=1736433 RepID=UPI0006F6913F|nr:hypothetical protein [Rhizobacter sp. Root1221]KQW00463.1 hypothetical protein ASC87_18100 [Rhizobacter sp. Root1221]